jgi:hypothetical protein
MTSWNKGDRVVHATHGSGTVLDVNEQHTVIHFDTGGRRKFASHLVLLEATGEQPRPVLTGRLPPMPRGTGQTLEGSTTAVGFRNANGQTVLRQTNLSGNVAGQRVYVLMCGHCSHEYGSNGFDLHLRKCPSCMGGQPGLAF